MPLRLEGAQELSVPYKPGTSIYKPQVKISHMMCIYILSHVL
jgi:hypothetical protein